MTSQDRAQQRFPKHIGPPKQGRTKLQPCPQQIKYLRLFSRAARRLHIQGAIRPLDRKVKRVILGHHRGGARSGFGCHSWFCPSPNSEDGAEPGRLTRPAQSSKRVARGRRAAAGSGTRTADGHGRQQPTAPQHSPPRWAGTAPPPQGEAELREFPHRTRPPAGPGEAADVAPFSLG